MKILMISSYLPYPLYSGGQIRLYNLLKQLKHNHEITLICEKRENQTEQDLKQVEEICGKVITVKRRKQWSVPNILKAGLSQHSFLFIGHTNQAMRQKIKEELATNQYDIIHVETYYVAQNIPRTLLPVVIVEHNIEYQVYSRFAKNSHSLLRPFLSIDIRKIKKEEEDLWRKASRVVAVSEEDKKIISQINPNVTVVANGVDPDKFSFKDLKKTVTQKEKKILFIGDFKWIQNRDSLTWIIREIWPRLRGQGKIKLWIVGREIPDSIKNLTDDSDILFDEKSSTNSAEQIFKEAYILLAPIRVGGGTSYKILEAMSVGAPAVVTPLSARGIQALDSKELLIGHSSEELADKALMLLNDESLYKKISLNGRAFIEKNYTWKIIAQKLNEVYKSTSR